MRLGLILTALLLAACPREQTLIPVAGAQSTANVSGVQLRVKADAWDGPQPQLVDDVTALRLTLENGTGVPLRVRYDQFRLVGPAGSRLAALPPLPGGLDPSDLEPLAPEFESSDFFVPPTVAPVFPEQGLWAGPFEYRSEALDGFGSWPEGLPTVPMIQRGIPEGVLEREGRISGFLYFPPLPEGVQAVVFEADLVDADSGERFASVNIPFAVEPK